MQHSDDPNTPGVVEIALPDAVFGRIDKALAEFARSPTGGLSRARIQALILCGAVEKIGPEHGEIVSDGAAAARAGVYRIRLPAVASSDARPQRLNLAVLFEDAHLIVVDKPAGMAAHPGPGTPDGTLVNALLHHCAGSLSGIGGVERPGIVHRLDKDTSGVMVAAKTDAAHRGLAALFESHHIERAYIALTRGAPDPRQGTVTTRIGRSTHDRKKMAVLKTGGREAVTHYAVKAAFGPAQKPAAARLLCRLETGRTHQIRVHMAHKGAPILGDPVYGSGSPTPAVRAAIAEAGLARQALHAAVLGFVHPITGEALRFETKPPEDMQRLEGLLAEL